MYQKPTLVIIALESADIITASNQVDDKGVGIIQDVFWDSFWE